MRPSSCCAIPSCAASRSSSAGAGASCGCVRRRSVVPTLRDYAGRGVITTATYEARAFGVHSGMGLMKAAKLAPDALLLPADFDEYRRYSRMFKDAVRAIAPHVEDRGIDEIYIDLTELAGAGDDADAWDRARAVAASIQSAVRDADGPVVLDRRHAEQAALEDRLRARQARRPHRAHRSRRARARLAARGAQAERHRSQGEREARSARHPHDRRARRRAEPAFLVEHFGKSYGAWMHDAANGRDERPVVTYSEPKSISRETTFEHDLHPVRDREQLSRIFTELCERVAGDLERKGYVGRTIGLEAPLRQLHDGHARLHDRRADARRRDDPARRGRVPEARAARPPHQAARRARGDAEQAGRWRRRPRSPPRCTRTLFDTAAKLEYAK